MAGSTDPAKFIRSKPAVSLISNKRLRGQIERSKCESESKLERQPEHARVENVVIKLARGHAAFELNEPQLTKPDSVRIVPLLCFHDHERTEFEGSAGDLELWPEVGSRAMIRLIEGPEDAFTDGWLIVQPDRYRYRTSQLGGLAIRLVIREYLAAEVVWD